ncbi:S1 family peptidase [Goodfellowiella coeruleoviolacea]|uniref:Streptogrisin C n=1 Tax=Goodfellowiella coeruleoviolacea TaxID=334858 RepID=A0AAE3GG21_9PSEU|nr:S1 family peptidase [Goodfellowiella coeruleoviolacea]MCP2167576.1 streptogrisin C [Goodfellowiella coeruleoviolacea]
MTLSKIGLGRLLGAATLLVGATAAFGLPAATASAEAASPEMFSAMQRDLGLTADQARTRMAQESAAATTEQQLRASLGESFGGARFDAASGKLVVGVTRAGAAEAVRQAGALPELVAHSQQTLDTAKAALDATTLPAAVTGFYVDTTSNSVVLTVRPGQAQQGQAFVAAAGVDASLVRVVESDEQPRTLYDVVGGDAYYINNSSRCSVGFSVQGGFVSAGHCGSTGASTTGSNRVAQGTFAGSSFPGNDYSYVRVNSNWTPRGLVRNSGSTVSVAGSTEAAVGASICRSGSTTGWHCGTLQAKNQTVNYAQGTVTGLTRTSVCAEPGDSGGSYISGQQAQGVTSGGSGNCSSGGTTYYQPVNEILSVYGLRLVTG